MSLLPKVAWISILAAAALSPASPQAAAQTAQVQRVALLKSSTSTQIEIQTSRRLIPLTQVLTEPDRLVIDFSDAVPSPEIRTIAVNNAAVKEVRVGRVTDNPPITRVVIDLKSPQSFQLVPSAHSVIVKIANGSSAPIAVAKEVPAETLTPTPAAPVAREAPPATVAPASTPEASKPEAPKESAKEVEAEKPAILAPAPQPAPARVALPAPSVAAVPVVARSVPATPVRAAVMTTAPDPVPTPTPGPTITISRVPVISTIPAQVQHVAVLKSAGATEIEIEISQRVTPEVQTVTGPDRLVIDFPQALPGPQLRAVPVNKGEVKGVRVGLLSAKPPVTRIVLDLKSPQAYQIFPSTRSVIVKLPDSASVGAPVPPPQVPPGPASPTAEPPTRHPPPPKVDIALQGGKLSLTSAKASLAEVLDELRRQTGAEIIVPPGAESEEVAVSLGPAAPRDVISQLLNGSRYNFIIVGADNDPNRVGRLILTPKTGGGVVPEIPSMPDSTPLGQVETAQRSGPGPVVPAAIEEAQPQGDSNPPPDTTPQPGDPQPAPN